MLRSMFAIAVLLCAGLTLASDNRIPAGYDTWVTIGSGLTFMSFDEEPIPAGFFCDGCEAYTGRINFEGVPLATNPPGLFGYTDTVIERLDEAVFDGDTAFARIRVKALHLRSQQTLVNEAGSWDVRVGLADEQPITTIDFNKQSSNRGTFNAELVLTVELTFINQDDPSQVRMLERTVHFTEFEDHPYTQIDTPTRVDKRVRHQSVTFEVDTDADGQPDSPVTLNPEGLQYLTQSIEQTRYTQYEIASHYDPLHAHTTASTELNLDDTLRAGLGSGDNVGQIDSIKILDPVIVLHKIRDLQRKGMLIETPKDVLEDVLSDLR